ncbi:MAG: GntR family transcriptional regulator [Acidobacteria bacterium]|nr:GntR family transcriptional regulator [Acidobacteriota bacterium]
MAGFVNVDPSDAVPIWKQIEDRVRRLAVSGSSPAGSGVPSVRELARELRVNPATVAKAYNRLTEAGVLIVRRGEGTFFAERSSRAIKADRTRILSEGAQRFAEVALSVKAGRAEAEEEIVKAFEAMQSIESGDEA